MGFRTFDGSLMGVYDPTGNVTGQGRQYMGPKAGIGTSKKGTKMAAKKVPAKAGKAMPRKKAATKQMTAAKKGRGSMKAARAAVSAAKKGK